MSFRRWKVILWGIKLENCSSVEDSMNAFAEFDIGGDREEVRVEIGNKQKVYAVGELKNRLRTKVIYGCKTGEPPTEFDYRITFEYRGSYLDVETEKMKIKVCILEILFFDVMLLFMISCNCVHADMDLEPLQAQPSRGVA